MTRSRLPQGSPDEGAIPLPGQENVIETLGLGHELAKQHAEHARLVSAHAELVQQLDQRTRRVNQLIGERSQLERSLARLEEQVQKLSRELGAARRSPPSPSRRVQWHAAGTRLIEALLAWRPGRPRARVAASVAAPARPTPAPAAPQLAPLVPFAQDQVARAIVAVVVFGLRHEQLSCSLSSPQAKQSISSMRCSW